MSSHHILNIVLGAALLLLVMRFVFDNTKKSKTSSDQSKRELVLENIHNRKSVRSYTSEPVAEKDLETLVKAGMAAPTAANTQPWEFVVITNRQQLNMLAEKLPYAKMLKQAPAAIAVCGNSDRFMPGEVESQYWSQDCSAATENILLAVEAMDLGAVWTGVFPIVERSNDVKEILELPEKFVVLNVIAIGHPDGDTPAKNKWQAERMHWKR